MLSIAFETSREYAGLNRVENEAGGERAAEQPRRLPDRDRGRGRGGPPCRGEGAGGDHQIERDQEVCRFAADLDRDAERHDRDRRDREPAGSAVECLREDPDDGDRESDSEGQRRRALAEVDDPRLVPDVAEDEQRRRGERERERGQSGAPIGDHDRGRGGSAGDQDPGELGSARVHGAPQPLFAVTGSDLPRSTVIRSGQTMNRPLAGSVTATRYRPVATSPSSSVSPSHS